MLSCTPIKQTFSVPLSCNMCTVRAKTSNIPRTVISQTDDGLSSLQAKYCHWKRFVPSTSSWLTPVKHNTNTIYRLLSTLINWTHFPTFLAVPVSDQDRAIQVASFCTVAPNIFDPSVRNMFHATPLTLDIPRRLPNFWKFINLWSKSSCTLHTNLHCKTNDTKIRTTTAYAHGIMTSLLRQHHLSSWYDQQSQSIVRTAEFETQLLLHCSFFKCDETFVIHIF